MLLVLLTLSAALVSQTVPHRPKSLPSIQVSNWADSLMGWRQSRSVIKEPHKFPLGPHFYRIAPKYDHSAIQQDTFAIRIGNNIYGSDPKLFEASPTFDSTGILKTEVYSYNDLEMPFGLTVNYMLPPHYPFYTVTYTLTNNGDDELTGSFLDYVNLNSVDETTFPSTTIVQNGDEIHSKTDFTATNSFFFSSGVLGKLSEYPGFSDLSYSASDRSNEEEEVIAVFTAEEGKLKNQKTTKAKDQQIGYAMEFTVEAHKSITITMFRSYRATPEQFEKAITLAHSTSLDALIDRTKREYSAWLRKAKMPQSLTQAQTDLYINSLLLLKNGQNPTIGTICASMHHGYEFKTWTRDGFFAALVLAEAGYPEEASKYFRWMSKCEMNQRDNFKGNYFSTCYSSFTGEKVGFVDPQLDSMGQFLIGAYHTALDPRTRCYIDEMKPRIFEVEEFLLQNVGYHNLFLPDYSIWEESSTPSEGENLNTGYFPFTHAFAYAGLLAASKLELHFLRNPVRAEQLRRRAMSLNAAMDTEFVYKEEGQSRIYRQLYVSVPGVIDSDGKKVTEDEVVPEKVADASTLAMVWLGCFGFASSSSPSTYSPPIRNPVALGQLNYVREKLSQALVEPPLPTSNSGADPGDPRIPHEYMGIGRYENDLYFTEKGRFSPSGGEALSGRVNPWGLTTMFTAWAELATGSRKNLGNRLRWMSQVAADGNLPLGECVRDDNQFVWSSTPDLYEHGGVYIWTALMNERLANIPNPMAWNQDNVA